MAIKIRPLIFSLIIIPFFIPLTATYSGEWITFTKDNTNLPSNNILCITIDGRGNKWFGTDRGLVQFDGEIWKRYSIDLEQNLTDNYVNDLLFEKDDDKALIWIATENGISILDITNYKFPTFSIPYRNDNSGLIDNSIKTLTIDPGHVRWFGTFSGVYSFYNDTWATYSTKNFWIDHDRVISLESGPDSIIYIGTEGAGVSRLKMDSVDGISSASSLNKIWTGLDEPDSGKLTSDNVYSILVEQNGCQWFGTDQGVALHTSYNTKRDWKNFTSEDGLVNNFVQAICKENENTIWFGTPQGVSRFDGFSWTNFTAEDGLAHNNIRDIAVDNNGSLWFATENGISVLTNTTAIARDKPSNKFDLIKINSYPNPFNSQTSITFTINKNYYIEIDIYNINGQQIASLGSEKLSAGNHHYVWDGSNTAGVNVPSGVYFVKLLAENQIKIHKILNIK